jgi:hypothetical protein
METATLTINLGGGSVRAAYTPGDATLARLSYVVTLSGSSTMTVGPTEPGTQTLSVTVEPGLWNITVTAYLNGEVYAEGSDNVEVRPGQSSLVAIKMKLIIPTFTSINDFASWLSSQPDNMSDDTDTTPYIVKLNVSDISGIRTILDNASSKYVYLNFSGSTFTSIGYGVFQGCYNLNGITLPNTVTSIGNFAFSDCGLTSITIPSAVTSIGYNAFLYCNLTSVTFETGSIQTANFDDYAFPEGFLNNGDALKNAYFGVGGGAGTYKTDDDGVTWVKQ